MTFQMIFLLFIIVGLSAMAGFFISIFFSAKRKNILEKELKTKEEKLSQKDNFLIEERIKLNQERESFLVKKEEIEKKEEEISKTLEKISGSDSNKALSLLKEKIEKEQSEDLLLAINKLENSKTEILEKKAQEIMAMAIQKYSKKLDNNLVTSSIPIPSEETKGKIIGREGRNIKTFEKETGVQLLVDQCPDEIIISSFDPIRREVAGRALKKLILDGIINPAKIEEFVKKSNEEVQDVIEKIGSSAAAELELFDIPKELLAILGRLHFRSSYGQNILKHSVEMAHISEIMAEELGANSYVAKSAALLHDIGKAVDFETKGTHIEIGKKILKKYNINEEIIKAMQSHHNEHPNTNLESYIIDAADAISGSRPGARSDNADLYIKKLEGLEKITKEFAGVSDAYAVSAGREVRVFVKPDEINDYNAKKMAREIALRIEGELKYPGEIKIALIREQRIVEFAR